MRMIIMNTVLHTQTHTLHKHRYILRHTHEDTDMYKDIAVLVTDE